MSHTAVVILNFNGEKLLKEFLPSVVLHSEQAEIIVVDNASSDRSLEILHRYFPTVRVISLDQNYGFCGGYNRGLKQIEADYIVLLNSDVEVTPNWLTPLTELAEDNENIAAIQPKILSFKQRNHFEYAGAAGGFIDSLGYPFCRGRLFDYNEEDLGQYNDVIEIFWATGACLFIRKKTFDAWEGFDEDFFAHMEEIDLCWKINRSGMKVMYCSTSTVYHLGAGTLGYLNPRKTYLNFRNNLVLLLKHYSLAELALKLPIRFGLDWFAAIVFLLKGQTKHTISVLQAQLSFLTHLGLHWKKRKEIFLRVPVYAGKTIYRGLIIWQYFVLKKRRIF